MTDEELDRARAGEAMRRYVEGEDGSTASIAARLAREGWTPPPPPVDPLLIEARSVVVGFAVSEEWRPDFVDAVIEGRHDQGSDVLLALAGIKHGLEIAGREGVNI